MAHMGWRMSGRLSRQETQHEPSIAVGAQHELHVFMGVEATGQRIIQQSREIGWRWSGHGRRTGVQAGISCGTRQPKTFSLVPF